MHVARINIKVKKGGSVDIKPHHQAFKAFFFFAKAFKAILA
jgi:hypothetical protein